MQVIQTQMHNWKTFHLQTFRIVCKQFDKNIFIKIETRAEKPLKAYPSMWQNPVIIDTPYANLNSCMRLSSTILAIICLIKNTKIALTITNQAWDTTIKGVNLQVMQNFVLKNYYQYNQIPSLVKINRTTVKNKSSITFPELTDHWLQIWKKLQKQS